MKERKLLPVHDDEHKYLKKIQRIIEKNKVLELKNRITMCKNPHARPIKQVSNQQGLQLIKRSLNTLKSLLLYSSHTIHQT